MLDAAVELLTDGGFAAVSHRAVANAARLPLAATTYYFRSRDDLIAAAFKLMVERDLAATRERFTAQVGRLGARAGDGDGGGPGEDAGASGIEPRISARAWAEALAAALLPRDDTERRRHLALWELYLRAGRDPALRPLARVWTDRCRETTSELLRLAGYPTTATAVRLLGAAVDGLEIEAVVETRPNAGQSMVEVLSRVLEWIRTTEGA
jgi:DNA-binding transcriptional regulator YbjK